MYFGRANVLLVALLCAACGNDHSDGSEEPDAGGGRGDIDAAAAADAEPPPPPPPSKAYGEFCLSDTQCISNVCYLQACSQDCEPTIANDCRDVDAFCISTSATKHLCYGRVETGDETSDDAILQLGDVLTRKLSPLGDADLFQIDLPVGKFEITARPLDDALDVGIEVYDNDTKNVANASTKAAGELERAELIARDPGRYFVVVRNLGAATAGVSIQISEL